MTEQNHEPKKLLFEYDGVKSIVLLPPEDIQNSKGCKFKCWQDGEKVVCGIVC